MAKLKPSEIELGLFLYYTSAVYNQTHKSKVKDKTVLYEAVRGQVINQLVSTTNASLTQKWSSYYTGMQVSKITAGLYDKLYKKHLDENTFQSYAQMYSLLKLDMFPTTEQNRKVPQLDKGSDEWLKAMTESMLSAKKSRKATSTAEDEEEENAVVNRVVKIEFFVNFSTKILVPVIDELDASLIARLYEECERTSIALKAITTKEPEYDCRTIGFFIYYLTYAYRKYELACEHEGTKVATLTGTKKNVYRHATLECIYDIFKQRSIPRRSPDKSKRDKKNKYKYLGVLYDSLCLSKRKFYKNEHPLLYFLYKFLDVKDAALIAKAAVHSSTSSSSSSSSPASSCPLHERFVDIVDRACPVTDIFDKDAEAIGGRYFALMQSVLGTNSFPVGYLAVLATVDLSDTNSTTFGTLWELDVDFLVETKQNVLRKKNAPQQDEDEEETAADEADDDSDAMHVQKDASASNTNEEAERNTEDESTDDEMNEDSGVSYRGRNGKDEQRAQDDDNDDDEEEGGGEEEEEGGEEEEEEGEEMDVEIVSAKIPDSDNIVKLMRDAITKGVLFNDEIRENLQNNNQTLIDSMITDAAHKRTHLFRKWIEGTVMYYVFAMCLHRCKKNTYNEKTKDGVSDKDWSKIKETTARFVHDALMPPEVFKVDNLGIYAERLRDYIRYKHLTWSGFVTSSERLTSILDTRGNPFQVTIDKITKGDVRVLHVGASDAAFLFSHMLPLYTTMRAEKKQKETQRKLNELQIDPDEVQEIQPNTIFTATTKTKQRASQAESVEDTEAEEEASPEKIKKSQRERSEFSDSEFSDEIVKPAKRTTKATKEPLKKTQAKTKKGNT